MLWRLGVLGASFLVLSACGRSGLVIGGIDQDGDEMSGSVGGSAASVGGSRSGGRSAGGSAGTAAAGRGAGAGGAGGANGGSSSEAGAGGANGGSPSEAGAGGANGGSPSEAGAGGEGAPDPSQPNIVFVTSKSYSPSALGGLEGADAQCMQLAAAAGLPGTFVAWLSTSTVDARDRLADASGWVNTHGQPFADQQAELFEKQVYYPVRYDEHGSLVIGRVATGTSFDGRSTGATCQSWTSDSAGLGIMLGHPSSGANAWTYEDSTYHCDGRYHVYCFQIDHQARLYPTPSQGRTAFVSAGSFTPGPGGRDTADQLCESEASAAALGGGPYVALIGTSTESPFERLNEPSRPWVRPDGMIIASDTAAMKAGLLDAPMAQQANGVHGCWQVLGSADPTRATELNCADWTQQSPGQAAVIQGVNCLTDARWHDIFDATCAMPTRVLCVEH